MVPGDAAATAALAHFSEIANRTVFQPCPSRVRTYSSSSRIPASGLTAHANAVASVGARSAGIDPEGRIIGL